MKVLLKVEDLGAFLLLAKCPPEIYTIVKELGEGDYLVELKSRSIDNNRKKFIFDASFIEEADDREVKYELLFQSYYHSSRAIDPDFVEYGIVASTLFGVADYVTKRLSSEHILFATFFPLDKEKRAEYTEKQTEFINKVKEFKKQNSKIILGKTFPLKNLFYLDLSGVFTWKGVEIQKSKNYKKAVLRYKKEYPEAIVNVLDVECVIYPHLNEEKIIEYMENLNNNSGGIIRGKRIVNSYIPKIRIQYPTELRTWELQAQKRIIKVAEKLPENKKLIAYTPLVQYYNKIYKNGYLAVFYS